MGSPRRRDSRARDCAMPEGYTSTADKLKRFNDLAQSSLSGTAALCARDHRVDISVIRR